MATVIITAARTVVRISYSKKNGSGNNDNNDKTDNDDDDTFLLFPSNIRMIRITVHRYNSHHTSNNSAFTLNSAKGIWSVSVDNRQL